MFFHACRLTIGRALYNISRSISTIKKSDTIFYNREEEISKIIKRLNNKPSITLYTGSPNCGKSTLIDHVLTRDEVFSKTLCKIDMRENAFDSLESFLTSMEVHLTSWSHRILSSLKNWTINTPVGSGDFSRSQNTNSMARLECIFGYLLSNNATF